MSDEDFPPRASHAAYLRLIEPGLARLRARLEDGEIAVELMVADEALHAFASDVYESAAATHLLSQTEYPRAAYPTARAAFEASGELLYLVSDPAQFLWRGCLARVSEAMEEHRVHQKNRAARVAVGSTDPWEEIFLPPALAVEEVARLWEGLSAGRGDWIRATWQHVDSSKETRARHGRHWTGLTRREIADVIARDLSDYFGHGECFDWYYSELSLQAHPGLRTARKRRSRAADGRVHIEAAPHDRHFPLGAALLSVEATNRALDRRVEPEFVASALAAKYDPSGTSRGVR